MKNTLFLFTLIFLGLGCAESDTPGENKQAEVLEPHRPFFHFTPPSMWMNDPNGMYFENGEYHLYYQYYPDSTVWGPMHWGHAVSTDLVHWEHLPVALYPDSLGLIFSGSAVVDVNNTSGLGTDGKHPVVAMFTHHDMEMEKLGTNKHEVQSIAYSLDNGRTFTKYAGNPVIANPGYKDFRDPKVLWDDVHGFWLMALAVEDHIKLWKSDDLKSWEHLSDWGKDFGEHGGVWECPDLFPIGVEGSDETKWVLLQNLNPGAPNGGSGLQYFVGDFDGKNFIIDPEFEKSLQRNDSIGSGLGIWLDYGKDNYAGVTWGNVPEGKRYFIGWMSNWEYATVVPTERWRSAMTLPRELKLVHTDAGYRLLNFPVKNLEALRLESFDLENTSLDKPLILSDAFAITANALEMEVVFEPEGKGNLELELKNSNGERYVFGYDKGKNMFYSDRRESGKTDFSEAFANRVHWSPRTATDGSLKLHIFLDRASIEVFADGGSTAVTNIFFPTEDYTEVRWTGDGSLRGTVWNLKKK